MNVELTSEVLLDKTSWNGWRGSLAKKLWKFEDQLMNETNKLDENLILLIIFIFKNWTFANDMKIWCMNFDFEDKIQIRWSSKGEIHPFGFPKIK